MGLVSDVRHGARSLLKAPGFTFTALLVLTLGISATTTVFSLIDAVLLRSLPYGEPERLVYMWTPIPEFKNVIREIPPPYADVMDWRAVSHSFSEITALKQRIVLVGGENPERVGCALVLSNFFQTFKASPKLGRAIEADDDRPGHRSVAVISDVLSRTSFAGNSSVLGNTIVIDSKNYRVIGVMPKDFAYPHGTDFRSGQFEALKRTDIWIPADLDPRKALRRPDPSPDVVIGRLRTGVTLQHAQSEMAAIEKRLAPLYPDELRGTQSLLVPFIESAVGSVRPLLHLILGAVLLVLLMVCVNVTNLMLARGMGRLNEIGIRTALGAQRSRLVRLMLSESLMLSVVSGFLGTLLSYAVLKVVTRLNPGDIPRFEEASINSRVLLFGLLISLGAGIVSGIFPALSASFVNVSKLLKPGSRGITGNSWRSQNLLIVAEIALSVVLLVAAGLLVRSYLLLAHQDKGFSPSTLTMSLILDERTRTSERLDAVRREVMARIRTIPGVQAAGSIDDLPLSRSEDSALIDVEGDESNHRVAANVRQTAGEYFKAMQIPLIAGRFLNDGDIPVPTGNSPKSVVVTAVTAKLYFRSPYAAIGRRLRFEEGWSTIVGVVGDVRDASLEKAPLPTLYWQCETADSLAIRTAGSPASIIASVRNAVKSVDSRSALTDIQPMNEYVTEATARRRFQTVILVAFSAVAIFLAVAGLYGLLSYAVRQRTAEIGVRVALGASHVSLIWLVIRYGLGLAGGGLIIGLAVASALARVMASMLYGVSAADPITFIVVPLLIVLVALIACCIPGWQAARTDPIAALRQQ